MHEIFISYRQYGSRGWAAYLHERMHQAFGPERVFLDHENLGIGDYQKQLDDALAQCKAFVLIIGSQWLQAANADGQRRLLVSDDVHRREIETALSRDGVTLIPLLVDGARMPEKDELPDSIRGLARYQAFDLPGGGWRGAGSLTRLISEISRATGLPVRGAPALWSAVRTICAVVVATVLSSIVAVVTIEVAVGVQLEQPEVSVLTLGLLAAWTALALWRRRRIRPPLGPGHV